MVRRHFLALGVKREIAHSSPARGTATGGACAPARRQTSRRARRGARGDSSVRGCLRPGGRKRSAATSSSTERQLKRSRKAMKRIDIELLRLMRGHARLAGAAHAEALLGLGKDDRRLARVSHWRQRRRRTAFAKSCPPRFSASISRIGHMRDERRALPGPPRRNASTIVSAVPGAELLVFAVDGRGEAAQQRVVGVSGEERVPFRAPQHLDDVPAGAAKAHSSSWMIWPLPRTGPSSRCRLQLMMKVRLSSFSRAARRQAGDRLRLVHLAVAEHAPDAAAIGVGETAVLR